MKKHLLAFFLLTACATIPKSEQVQIMAAHDFKCDSGEIHTTTLDRATIRAIGCGHDTLYREQCVSEDTTRCTWIPVGAARTTVSR